MFWRLFSVGSVERVVSVGGSVSAGRVVSVGGSVETEGAPVGTVSTGSCGQPVSANRRIRAARIVRQSFMDQWIPVVFSSRKVAGSLLLAVITSSTSKCSTWISGFSNFFMEKAPFCVQSIVECMICGITEFQDGVKHRM